MAKAKTPVDEKFEQIDFNLFEALEAIDRKDYGYYDRLTEEQKKKFAPFMAIKWVSYVTGRNQHHYTLFANEINKNFLNEKIYNHPKLQWQLLCVAGIGMKQFRKWIPQISEKVSSLKDKAAKDDVETFFGKVYSGTDKKLIKQMSELYLDQQHKKFYLAKEYPTLKLDEIELLNAIISDAEIEEHKKNSGT
jgi:hypothetical protein